MARTISTPSVGDKVLAKWKDGKFYPGEVIGITGTKAKVQWDDGTRASIVIFADVYPEKATAASKKPTKAAPQKANGKAPVKVKESEFSACDRAACRKLRESVQRVLDDAGLGLNVKVGNASYLPGVSMTFKIDFVADRKDSTGNAVTKESETYKRYCESYGLKPAWLFKKFKGNFSGANGHDMVTVIGLNTRRGKYPVILRNEKTGKSFATTPEVVISHMGK